MRTKLVTVILLATVMMSYLSCSSDEPILEEEETPISNTVQETVSIMITQGTFKCEALNSSVSFNMIARHTYKGDAVVQGNLVPDWYPYPYVPFEVQVNKDYTLTSTNVENYQWKLIDNNTLAGLTKLTEGTWKRVK